MSRARVLLNASSNQTPTGALEGEDCESASAHLRQDAVVAVALTSAGDLLACMRLKDLGQADDEKQAKRDKEQLERTLSARPRRPRSARGLKGRIARSRAGRTLRPPTMGRFGLWTT